jgi:hypothetical protein
MFFVDSVRALREQQTNQRPTGDFLRLYELLSTQLAASYRTQIRRANLIDLVQSALDYCRDLLSKQWPAINQLELVLEEQQKKMIAVMADRLRTELLLSQNLWERRLLASVTQNWGFSPFSSVLRLYNGLGTLIASAGLFRARSTAQMALIGAVQGARWLAARQQESQIESNLERLGSLGIDDTLLRESQLVVVGYVREAEIDVTAIARNGLDGLRREAARVEGAFLDDARRGFESIITRLAARQSGSIVRWVYEVLLLVMLAYILGRPAYNFFYASFWLGEPLITADFYIHGAIFLVLWSGLLVMLFTRRLRCGLQQKIGELALHLAHSQLASGLFAEIEHSCLDFRQQREKLEVLSQSTAEIRRSIAGTTALGAQITPLAFPGGMALAKVDSLAD